MDFFPYPDRPFQSAARAILGRVASEGGHVVLEMPTGSGKTVVLLSAALQAAQATGRRILYVTRTNSQQEQAIREFNAVRKSTGLPLRAVALQGRARLCSKLAETEEAGWSSATPEELSHYCSSAKASTERDRASPRSCRFYAGLLDRDVASLAAVQGSEALTAERWMTMASLQGLCAYEANKRLMPEAHLVVAPYIFAMDPGLRARLFDWWGVQPNEVVLIVDEAHNLPEYLRDMHSPRLGGDTVPRAIEEATKLGNPEVLRGANARTFLETLQAALERIVREYTKDEDGFVPPYELETELLGRFATTTSDLRKAADVLVQLGEIVRDKLRALGKVPRSSLVHVGRFVRGWLASDEEGYVKLAGVDPKPYLEAFLVDSARLGDDFGLFAATIHASGTLAPLEEYRDSLGLPQATRLEKFPSPFDPSRLKVRAASGVTTRHELLQADPAATDRIQDATRTLVEAARISGAVFFPSHRLLQDFVEVGVFQSAPGALIESRNLDQAGLMRMVATHRSRAGSSLLVGVLGGRLSEGLDFPGRQLELALVVGVPYPKPTAHQRALFHYHESKSGRGWEYSVRAPALRRLRQAMGRLVRSEDDRGFVVILDERAGPLLRAAGYDVETRTVAEIVAELSAWQEAPNGPGDASKGDPGGPRS